MLTVIAVAGLALVAGVVAGWLLANPRVHRAEVAQAVAETRVAEMERARSTVADTFAAEAQRAFQRVGESMLQMSKTQIDGSLDTKRAEIETLLTPVRQMLDQYRGELVKSERVRNEAYGGLQQQILTLMTLQQSAEREASRLANALQSPSTRGNWGEITLRRCVELAGMTEYCDFFIQETIESDEGRRLRPDMIIRLPNRRMIAVDSKAPIASASDDAQRNALMRRHVDALSRKEYQSALGDTLDFVVMFVPGEQFLPHDSDLFEWAVQRKIFIASPAIFIPLLRAVEAGWKAERTEENAKRMHDAGVELFNRFVKVMELFADLGNGLARTVEKYNAVVRSIDARLWPKGEELQRMAGVGKELAGLEQIEAVPLESSKLRLTMQGEAAADVVPFEK